jgi:hypothetical protein
MKGEFGYKNKLAAPRFVKVVVSSGTGTTQHATQAICVLLLLCLALSECVVYWYSI